MYSSSNRNTEVYFRIFPMKNMQGDLLKIENSTIYIKKTQDVSNCSKNQSKYWQFKTDGVFCNDSQESVYSQIIKGLLERILIGHNGIIAGFGQTGTGKSFTIGGLQHTEQDFGIAPRVILDLFKSKKDLPKNMKMCIEMSYTEFSKLSVADLLKDFPNSIDQWHVKNATKVKVSSVYEALKVLYKGEGRKSFANNNAPYMSHVGSSVLTFYITTANQDFTCPEKVSSRLHIIDLAGVDSLDSISSNFKNPVDVGEANITKSYLEQFIVYLMENIPSHIQVKERSNPLIYFLGNDLTNKSLLRFIGHIRIQKEDLKITLSILRFGQLVKGLKLRLTEVVPEINEELKLQHLQSKLEYLQKEKIYKSVLMNQDLTKNLNQQRMDHIHSTVQAYLHNRLSELSILNVTEASEVFKILKGMYNLCEEEKSKVLPEGGEKLSKHHGSKSSSKSSIKLPKSSSKRMRRSKEDSHESINIKSKRSSVLSQQHSSFVPAANINTSVSANKMRMVSSQSQPHASKKGRTNSLSKQPSFTTSKKSNAHSSIKEKKESKNNIHHDASLIPDIMPEFREAWNTFCNDSNSSYKILYESYTHNENELKSVYVNYLKEINALQLCKEVVNKRKNEVLEAKMFQKYISSENVDSIVDSETICQENLINAEARLVEQQEAALKLQSEIKIYLSNRVEIKLHLGEEFDQYCNDHFGVHVTDIGGAVPDSFLMQETTEVHLDGEDENIEQEEQDHIIEIPTDTIRIDKLKQILQKELHKTMKLKAIKNRRWKNVALKY